MLPSYPSIVNNSVVRMVALFVFILGALNLYFQNIILAMFLCYGFVTRALWADRIDPTANIIVTVFGPFLPFVPKVGIPKRFAQAIGAICSCNIVLFSLLGFQTPSLVLSIMLVVFSGLEAFLGFCVGCWMFNRLMDWGLIPASTCEACNNVKLY